ncbi:MAG: hypothetical protein Q9160_000646 [Pyrenula sp. 1 TL-2023]
MERELVRISLQERGLGLGGRGSHLVIPAIAGPLFSTLLVLNRAYFRFRLVRKAGVDDILIIVSLLFLWGLGVVDIIAVDHGYGRPSKSLSSHDLAIALQMFWADQILYKFTINLTKLSILAFYLRVFSKPWFRVTCWITAAIVSLYGIISIIVTIFQCSPVNRVWDKSMEGTCINLTSFWYSNAIYNILTDIIIMVSVPFVIWVLDLSKQQRIGLIALFGLVVFLTMPYHFPTTSLRCPQTSSSLAAISNLPPAQPNPNSTFTTSLLRITTLNPASKTPDQTRGTLVSTIWTMIEPSMAIICACLPMLRPPLKIIWPRLFPTRSGRSGAGAGTESGEVGGSRAGGRGLGGTFRERAGVRRLRYGVMGRDDEEDIEMIGRRGLGNGDTEEKNETWCRDLDTVRDAQQRGATA